MRKQRRHPDQQPSIGGSTGSTKSRWMRIRPSDLDKLRAHTKIDLVIDGALPPNRAMPSAIGTAFRRNVRSGLFRHSDFVR